MVSLRMSFDNGISVPILLVLFATGITGAIWSDAERAVHNLADVAHVHHFELKIRSSSPDWFREGMQLFAWEHEGCYWVKRKITWAVMNESRTISREDAEEVMEAAFEKWAEKIPLTFEKISHNQQPDIRVGFGQTEPIEGLYPMGYAEHAEEGELDAEGVDIVFDDHMDWANENDAAYYRNLRYCGLLMIGHALGLGSSKNPRAIMYAENRGYRSKYDPVLDGDDIRGIQALYSMRGSSEPSSRLPANLKPASSIPVEPTRPPLRPPVAASSSSSQPPSTHRSRYGSDEDEDDYYTGSRMYGGWGRHRWERDPWNDDRWSSRWEREERRRREEFDRRQEARHAQEASGSRGGSGAMKKIRNFFLGKKK